MTVETLILAVIIIFAVIFVIKFIAKNFIKILVVALVLSALLFYLFLVVGSDENDLNFVDVLTEYSLDDLQAIYCKRGVSYADSIKCQCIIRHINDDLHSRFSEREIEELKKKRLKLAMEIVKSFNNKKNIIKEDLKRNNALHLLDEFKTDIISKNFLNK